MKYLFRASILLVFFLMSCSQEAWLTGTLNMTDGTDWKPMVYLVQPEKFNEVAQSFTDKVLDSAKVNGNGQFQFVNSPGLQEQVLLKVVVQRKNEKFPNRLINQNPETDNYFPLVYEPNAKIKIDAAIASFQSSFSLEQPSQANKAMLRLRDERMAAYKKHLKGQASEHNVDDNLLEREKNLRSYQEELIHFSDSTVELLPALMALRWASPEGDYERIAELVYAQAQKWNAIFPEHDWVKELVSVADKGELPILIGDTITELQFPMKNGEDVSLQEVINGKKLILLDVWASWCAPCRVENRDILVPLWERYNSQNFQIVAYALESSKKAWENAIEKDGAHRWLHASHLEGDQNPFMEALRLKTIPANFLLNKEGRVLAKNLHGQDLIDFVDDYMEKN